MRRHVGRSGIPVVVLAVGLCLTAPGCVLKGTFEEKTNALASDIASVRTVADANKADIQKILTDITALQTQVAALGEVVKGLQALTPRVDRAEQLLTGHTAKLGELATAGRNTDGRVGAVAKLAAAAATKESVDAATKDLSAKVAAQAAETARVAGQFKRMTAMSGKVIQDLERVKNAQTKLDSTMGNLRSWAKTSLEAQDKIIAADRGTLAKILQAEYATLEKRMKELQEAIGKLKGASSPGAPPRGAAGRR